MKALIRGLLFLLRISPASVIGLAMSPTSAPAQSYLSTEEFLNLLTVCAAGINVQITAKLAGSVEAIYEGEQTNGWANVSTVAAFLEKLPEDQRADAYKLYIDCVKDLLDPARNRALRQKIVASKILEDTPISTIADAFGRPTRGKKAGDIQLDLYEGIELSLVMATRPDGVRDGLAVMRGTSWEPLKSTDSFTYIGDAAEWSIDYYMQSCVQPHEREIWGVDTRFGYSGVGPCYLGRPYVHHEVAYDFFGLNDYDCTEVDTLDLTSLDQISRCAEFNKDNLPLIHYVYYNVDRADEEYTEDEETGELLLKGGMVGAIMSWLRWNE